jgi:cysteine synthase A
VLTVTDDEAMTYARQAAQKGGWLVGISSGANLAAAHRLAHRPEYQGQTILTVMPDGADRYGSTPLFA